MKAWTTILSSQAVYRMFFSRTLSPRRPALAPGVTPLTRSFLNDGAGPKTIMLVYFLCAVLLAFGIGLTWYSVLIGLPLLLIVVGFTAAWTVFERGYRPLNPQLTQKPVDTPDEPTTKED